MAASLARGLKVAFVVMSCVSNAVLIHLIATQGLLFLPEFHTMWAMSFLFDFNVLLIPIVIWIIYKESNWKNTIMWAFPILMIGSSTFCPYIVVKLMELSPQESEDDPIYFVLLTKKKRDERESRSILPVIIARFYFGYMAGYMVILWTYTIAVDGFPLRRDVFTPFALATFIDIHFLLITFSIWVAYKEPTWITAAFWIVMLMCFHSIGAYLYILRKLFKISRRDPVSRVLFNRTDNGYEETLLG
ncbi:uncharacterized protein LOC127246767 [Andrographis paniculata]|uniref:uncharacterized protein LOC127246767 n=1 Tax=Andrographis paniculata TaxID=175694 RepID=UPI0021E954BC|nr:uncharacterized protein LOC127246767 [Andrographis paniculata]